MPLQVEDVTTLQNYLQGIVQKAGHHAANIRYVVYPLIGAIVRFKDLDQQIRVFTREGEMGNVLWVHINGTQYAFSFEHESKSVVLKQGNTHGDAIAHFTNATTIPQILEVFEAL